MKLSGTIFVLFITLLLSGCVDRAAQLQAKETSEFLDQKSKVVATTVAKSEFIEQDLEISGEMVAGQDTTVSALQPGRIVQVFVKDGDSVKAGQVIAKQDTKVALDQLRQARAALNQALSAEDQAREALDQAERSFAVGPQKSLASLKQAQARLRSARAAYELSLSGARPEERRQAEADVEATRIALDTAERELSRTQRLVASGAVPGRELEIQRSNVAAAKATHENAVQNLAVIKNGNRKEDIDQALEQVREAEETVRIAEADRRLDPILQSAVNSAMAQVRNARAQVDSGLAGVSMAEQVLRDTDIRSPFAGKVSGRPVQVGTIVDASTAIVRVIGGGGLYFNGQLPSTKSTSVRIGMRVSATVEGLPGVTLSGRVAAVSPVAQGSGRLFDIRVQFYQTIPNLKAGMFVKGKITSKGSDVTIVPDYAVLSKQQEHFVFVVDDGIAKQIKVTLGQKFGEKQSVAGISPGETIVSHGQHLLVDGDNVTIDNSLIKEASK